MSPIERMVDVACGVTNIRTQTMNYPFTEEEFRQAAVEWGCNCGPSALAFFLQTKLEAVRGAIPDFEAKRFTSPTMMKAALRNMGKQFTEYSFPRVVAAMFGDKPALVRIQFCGPWTEPGANPRWAYRHTHWIVAWKDGRTPTIFDCNGGLQTFTKWKTDILPLLIGSISRSNGEWFPTHIWRLR